MSKSSKSTLVDLANTLSLDIKVYEKKLDAKLAEYKKGPIADLVDLGEKIGNAYMRGYRKAYGTAYVIKIPKEILAFLYNYAITNGYEGAAVGLANYSKAELVAGGGLYDPFFKPERENQNTVMVGVWDKGIIPFEKSGIKYYDDWNDEWP